MHYFKNVELAEKYHISEGAVRNWIKEARQDKLQLELVKVGNRTYVANNASNLLLIEKLITARKKFRNGRSYKVAAPNAAFYDLFDRKQILDIITNLDVHREIPRQYNYFDTGAKNWEKFTEHRMEEDEPNLLKRTIELMHANMTALDVLLGPCRRVNVIDIGPGNGRPVKELLEHLVERGVLHRYIAIDISEEMLNIAERNIKKWFGDAVQFEGYVRDITHERFNDVLVDDMLDEGTDQIINLAVLFGNTLMNFRDPYDALKVIYGSLGLDDLLVFSTKPDAEFTRQNFDVNAEPGSSALSPKYSFIFDLLNIDRAFYDVEMGFNEKQRLRYIRVRLKVALTIRFTFEGGERKVDLDKGETILLWRVWHQTTLEFIAGFEKTGFILLQSNMTQDRQYLLTISGIDAKLDAGN